jgi:hypothetical protein
MTEQELLEAFFEHIRELKVKAKGNLRFITYNGENFKGGFDFPFLRTRTIVNGMWEQWPFTSLLCFDLYEHMKRFNTQYENDSVTVDTLDSNFTAEQVMGICADYNFPAIKGKKKDNCDLLVRNHERMLSNKESGIPFKQYGYKTKIEPGMKLDHVYLAFGGQPLPEKISSISGGDVPQMWLDYMAGDDSKRDLLIEYNKSDVEQLEFVWKRCYSMLPKKSKQMGWTDL